MGYRDSNQTAGSSVAQQECHEEVCKKTPPAMSTGKCTYYKNRHDNYIKRHQDDSKTGGDNPPSYYLEYGFKYCSTFKEQTYNKFSAGGKVWLVKVLIKLQEFMEQGVVKKNWKAKVNRAFNKKYLSKNTDFYIGIECRDADFRAFAFATHPDAYDPKAMQTLPCSDLILIASTPELKEWLSFDTWEQAGVMIKNMDVTNIAFGCIDEASEHLLDKAEEVFEDLAHKMTRW
jgi:hypothetical protein